MDFRRKLICACLIALVGMAAPARATGHKRLVIVFVDVTRSLVDAERDIVANQAAAILSRLRPGTEFRVYPIHIETELVTPIASGKVRVAANDLDRGPEREMQKVRSRVKEQILQLYGIAAAGTDNQSCILNSLSTAGDEIRRFRSQFRAQGVELDLIYVSDMIEECDRTPLGAIELDKKDIHKEIEAASRLRCDAKLADVRVSVVIPAMSGVDRSINRDKRPDLRDRKEFWTRVFRACGFQEPRFDDAEWFNFSTSLPNRFQKAR